MTTTYRISEKLYKDFKNACTVKGITPAKTVRRLCALVTIKPEYFNKILTQDFLMDVAKDYGFTDL